MRAVGNDGNGQGSLIFACTKNVGKRGPLNGKMMTFLDPSKIERALRHMLFSDWSHKLLTMMMNSHVLTPSPWNEEARVKILWVGRNINIVQISHCQKGFHTQKEV